MKWQETVGAQSEVKNTVLQKSKPASGLLWNSWRWTCGTTPGSHSFPLSQNSITMHEFKYSPVIHVLSPPRCIIWCKPGSGLHRCYCACVCACVFHVCVKDNEDASSELLSFLHAIIIVFLFLLFPPWHICTSWWSEFSQSGSPPHRLILCICRHGVH